MRFYQRPRAVPISQARRPEPGQGTRGAVALVLLQGSLVASLMGWLLLTPPVEGQMMLVPITGAAAAALPSLALRGGTKLVATGPIRGSLIVYGRRAGIARRLLAYGIVTVATPPGGCTPDAAA